MIHSRRFTAAVLLLAALLPAWAAGAGHGPQRRPVVEDTTQARVIVKYRSDSTLMRAQSATAAAPRPQHAAALGLRLGLPLADGRVLGARTQALRGQGVASAELARRLAQQADVEWAVVDGRKTINAVVPNDTYYGNGQSAPFPVVGQWYLRAPDSTFVATINAVGAWATTTGSSSITVAVLDTGIRPEHPDFKKADGSSKLYAGYDFIGPDSAGVFTTAGDGNGRDSDATDPGDWTTSSDSCGAGSSSWHGTQTAGIIGAATDNAIGMASVGRDVMVLPVRVLGKCGGYDSDIIAAMRWAAGVSSDPIVNAHPAKVLNMSLGSTGACSTPYQDVFNELNTAGVSVVVAAGNDEGLAVGTPANCPHAIAVGGVRHIGTKVGFSDAGPEITVSAPAGNCVNLSGNCLYPILTTTNAGTTTATTSTYSDMSDASLGTSFSAPMVAGAVALMLSVDATLTPDEIKSVLKSTARPFPTTGSTPEILQCHAPNGSVQDECYCTASTCGAGLLDVGTAVLLPPAATVSASTSTPTAGSNVALSTSDVAAFRGRTITGYAWAVTSGATLASISGSAIGPSATLATSGAGDVTVELAVTDSGGGVTRKSIALAVQPAPVGSGNSGGGGGAFSPAWLALLALGVLALRRAR